MPRDDTAAGPEGGAFAPEIHIGDCARVMPALPGPFDLVVTSPPYDAGKAYEGRRDLAAYTEFARRWMAEIPRLLKPSGSLWLNVGYTKAGPNEALPLSYVYYGVKPPGLRLVQEIVWHYEGGMSYKKRFTHRTERWMWFAPDPETAYFDLDVVRDMSLNRTRDRRNNPLGKNPSDYWYFDRVVGGAGRSAEKTAHPCQFPERMVERVLKACCPPGGAVLDPFAGSGTVGRVASRLGMASTLIEANPAYLGLPPVDAGALPDTVAFPARAA